MHKAFMMIGCGRIAYRHAEEMLVAGRLVAACDPDPQALAAFCSRYNIPGFRDLSAMLQAVEGDTAVVCSPNACHPEQVAVALEAGLDVLCEKPLCLHGTDARRLLALEAASRKNVYLVLSARYHSLLQALRRAIAEGRLGEIFSFQMNAAWHRDAGYYTNSRWRGSADMDGGVLYTQFSHYLDALCWCLGPVGVQAVSRRNAAHPNTVAGEDCGTALLQAAGGAIGTLHWTINATHNNMEVSLLVVAEKATIRIGGAFMNELTYLQAATGEAALETFFSAAQENNPRPGNHHRVYKALAGETGAAALPGIAEGIPSIELIESIYHAG